MESPSGMYQICVWPDNDWVLRDEYSEHEWQWHGDDFRIVNVPLIMEAEDIDKALSEGRL